MIYYIMFLSIYFHPYEPQYEFDPYLWVFTIISMKNFLYDYALGRGYILVYFI